MAPGALRVGPYSILVAMPGTGFCYYSHLIDRETEVQSG